MKKKWFYLLAFLIPFVAMLGICIANGVYPFGKNSFMHCDMYHQYVPFLTAFWRKLHEGEGLVQAWNLGLGTEFAAVYAYYLATPTNWLVYFCPEHLIIEYMTFMILIKIALCGPTFAYFLRTKFNSGSPMILGFSTLYALSGFVAAYNWNHMWMDVIWLAPLILIGLEKLVKERKCKLYCLALTASIFTNYYLSIMLCIFLVFYFLVLLFTGGLKWKEKAVAILNFGVHSLLAGGMTAILLIPVMYAMRATGFDDSTFPKNWEFYFNGLEVLTRHFLTIPKEIGLDHWPNIYCGISVFLLVPMYLFCGKIPLRQRIAKVLLAAFMMLSFCTNILNFLWHGFNYPNSLPARQSYLYIFLILTMGYEVVMHVREWKVLWFTLAAVLGTAVMALCSIFVTTEGFTVAVAAASWCFFCVYVLLAILCFLLPKRRMVLMWLVIAIFVGESTFNMAQTSVPVVQRNYYATKWENYENLLEIAKEENEEEDFYRFQSFCYMTKNDGMLAGYPGISVFSSTTNSSVKDLYNKMGMEGTKVSYYSEGTTALTSAMLGVRYTFSENEEDEALYRLAGESGKMKLYENRYTLPVGYVLSHKELTKLEEIINAGGANNIQTQNKMSASLGIAGNLFVYMGQGEALSPKEDGHYYAFLSGDSGDTVIMSQVLGLTGEVNGANGDGNEKETVESAENTKEFDGLKKNCIIDLGALEACSSWKLTKEGNEKSPVKAWFYKLDESVLGQLVEKMGKTPFKVTDYEDGFMKGTVTVEKEGRMLFSIPADEGWHITVDGKEVEPERWMDAFISISLESGEHEIVMTYKVQGLLAGLGISLICLGLFVIIAAGEKKRVTRYLATKQAQEIPGTAETEQEIEIAGQETQESGQEAEQQEQNIEMQESENG
ncbi:MAG: YfhO family protein [Lachnospiraceae bacterium]|nr:YfhO family protein [Lachnospiraceae bacterium]